MFKDTDGNLWFLMLGGVSAQQQPYYTQYILNNFILNPALAGIETDSPS
jgi:hypothetical protein